jgi:hypothetical protein
LKVRNPRVAPARATASNATIGCPSVTDVTNIARRANTAVPAAAPSIPSRRLNALVMPTIHTTVKSRLRTSLRGTIPNGSHSVPTRTPAA